MAIPRADAATGSAAPPPAGALRARGTARATAGLSHGRVPVESEKTPGRRRV
jgi:hypothetical protein